MYIIIFLIILDFNQDDKSEDEGDNETTLTPTAESRLNFQIKFSLF